MEQQQNELEMVAKIYRSREAGKTAARFRTLIFCRQLAFELEPVRLSEQH